MVDLQNLGIQTLDSNAFAGTSNLEILLGGNSVSRLFPESFPTGVVHGGQNCTDYVGWSDYCSELASETTCDQTTCSNEISPYIVSSLGISAVDACCALGGGHSDGANLIMDEISPITCSSGSSNEVMCKCSEDTERYNIITSSCISSCVPGMGWESVISDLYDNINSDVASTKKVRSLSSPFRL